MLFPKTEHPEHFIHTSRFHFKIYLNVIGGGSEHRRSGSCPQEPYLVGDMKCVWELLGYQPENSKGSESEKGIIMHHSMQGDLTYIWREKDFQEEVPFCMELNVWVGFAPSESLINIF